MFPKWLTENDNGEFCINADIAYADILTELKNYADKLPEKNDDENEAPHLTALRALDVDNIDQYWVEVAYQFVKLEVVRLIRLSGVGPWNRRQHINGSKDKWHFKNLPVGRGVEAAAQGKEAREMYRLLRGFIPN